MNINAYIEKAREDRASDLHLVCALPPKYRVDGEIRDLEPTPLTAQFLIVGTLRMIFF